jgi:hypothetical protein
MVAYVRVSEAKHLSSVFRESFFTSLGLTPPDVSACRS